MADQDPNDIRKWLSPKNNTTTPKRRRRVMSTSSSDNERHGPGPNSATQQTPSRSAALPNAGATNNAQPPPSHIAGNGTVATSANAVDVIELSSSDDSMYIYRRDAQAGGGAAVTSPRPAAAGGGAAITSPRPAAEQRKSSSKGNRPRRNTKRCGTQIRKSQKFTAEAQEVSTDHDSRSESCDESETNAQDLYHEAIMGVRNANHARCQLRSKTINCPVCAKFATFLQHFM